MANRQTQRISFVGAFNVAFGPSQIAATLDKLRPFLPAIDALEIVQRLHLLTWVPDSAFLDYRSVVGIPPVNMQVLTVAFHGALLHVPGPIPLHLSIVEGPVEAVAVAVQPGAIAVTLTRTFFEPPISASPVRTAS